MTTTINSYQERARTMKALQLTSVLRSAGATTTDVDDDTVDWVLAARVAAVNPPSADTKSMVRAMLAAAEGDTPSDPFAGLL